MPGWRLGQGLQGAEGIWENLRDLGRGVSLQRGAWGGGTSMWRPKVFWNLVPVSRRSWSISTPPAGGSSAGDQRRP